MIPGGVSSTNASGVLATAFQENYNHNNKDQEYNKLNYAADRAKASRAGTLGACLVLVIVVTVVYRVVVVVLITVFSARVMWRLHKTIFLFRVSMRFCERR